MVRNISHKVAKLALYTDWVNRENTQANTGPVPILSQLD